MKVKRDLMKIGRHLPEDFRGYWKTCDSFFGQRHHGVCDDSFFSAWGDVRAVMQKLISLPADYIQLLFCWFKIEPIFGRDDAYFGKAC